MKRLLRKNINTPDYWDSHQTAVDFGLRQREYAKLVNGNSVVELGCGLSPFLFKIKAKTRCGVDFSKETIKICTKMYPGVTFVHANAIKTPFVDKQFDVSVSGEVIEHMTDPFKFINEMKRITKKRIIISTPILEFVDPEHLWEFNVNSLKDFLPGGHVFVRESKRFPGRKYLFAYYDL